MKLNQRTVKKVALSLSIFLLVAWMLMGTGTSIAWFTDTDEEIRNIFHFATFELNLSYLAEDGTWKPLEGSTELFDDEALYEPGYTQVVYLTVKNTGEVPFLFDTAVSIINYTPGVNMFGQRFYLQDYLLFGVVGDLDQQALEDKVATRELAREHATVGLSHYAPDATTRLEVGDIAYLALVVYMPENVDNIANYRENVTPKVELGVIVRATQVVN